jgi:hypothetical protein
MLVANGMCSFGYQEKLKVIAKQNLFDKKFSKKQQAFDHCCSKNK